MTFDSVALRARWLALARRERGLALAAALVLVLGIGELLLIEPPLTQRARLVREMQAQQREQQALQQVLGGSVRDPNAPLRAQRDGLQAQVRAAEHEFRNFQNGLVQPQNMGALLQSLLTEHRGLRLLGLRSLPVTPIGDTGGVKKILAANERAGSAAPTTSAAATVPIVAIAGAAGDDAWLYRHAVEVRVQGSYADMLAYLHSLESMPRRVHWGDLEIDARKHPANVMTVTLFTVSLEKSWWVL